MHHNTPKKGLIVDAFFLSIKLYTFFVLSGIYDAGDVEAKATFVGIVVIGKTRRYAIPGFLHVSNQRPMHHLILGHIDHK